jgi:ribulose bisphosphate carboxylase small subunit
MPRLFPLALLAALVACGTPQEQCINRATREYRAVSQLLTEVEGNLARGYAWQEYHVTRTRWEICGYRTVIRQDGTAVQRPRMCLEDYTDTLRRRAAIDPQAETRKRDALVQRKNTLARQAQTDIAACKAAHPETP